MNFAFDWYFRRRTVKEEKEECVFSKENRQGVDIIDFIIDRYLENSIKTQTRGGSGEGMLISVRKDIPSSEDFKTFMRDSHNKAELFFMMAISVNQIRNVPFSVIATVYEKMLSNCFDIDFEKIMPCNHKKADTRLILHVFDACRKSYKKLTTACSDTDIAVIALYHFYDLDVNELWIEYCVGQHKRWEPIHEYAKCLWEEICRALPFLFAITGCDIVTAFNGRGKRTAWDVWGIFGESTRSVIK